MEYLLGDLILLIVWLVLFARRKDLRREMFVMSALSAPLALFDLLYVPTYWIPRTLFNIPIGFEGVMGSFFIGGIASAIYAELEHKKLKKLSRHRSKAIAFVLLSVIPVAYVFNSFYQANVAIAMYAGLAAGIAILMYLREDLVKSTVIGGLVFGLIYAIALIIWSTLFPSTNSWFTLIGLPKIFIFNAPIYEIIFGFLFGAYWGSLYELIFNYRFKN